MDDMMRKMLGTLASEI